MPSLKLGSVELLTRVAREVQPAALGRRLLEFFLKIQFISFVFLVGGSPPGRCWKLAHRSRSLARPEGSLNNHLGESCSARLALSSSLLSSSYMLNASLANLRFSSPVALNRRASPCFCSCCCMRSSSCAVNLASLASSSSASSWSPLLYFVCCQVGWWSRGVSPP